MRKLIAVLTLGGLVLTACGREGASRDGARAGATRTAAPESRRPREIGGVVQPASTRVSLERFDACPALIGHLRSEALARVGPYGLPGSFGGVRTLALEDAAAAPGASSAESGDAARSAPAPSHSSTNVQEANVDEPDAVKTDGRHIFTIRPQPGNDQRQRLTSVSVEDGSLRLAGGVLLPEAHGYELLLSGDRILAMGARGGFAIADDAPVAGSTYPAPAHQGTVIAVVDVSDPSNMRITHKLELDGTYASARMAGGIARIVLNSQTSRIAWAQPAEPTVEAEKEALEANKRKITVADVDEWLPRFQLQDESGKVVDEGPMTSCASTYHPKTFSGFGEVSVVTVDPADPDPRESAAVIGSAGTVYASSSNLYVATQEWPEAEPLVIENRPIGPQERPQPAKTSLHRFDISDPARAVYAASGEVRGTVLNQWSLSEHEGYLRVATTEDRFAQQDRPPTSSNFVTVLTATGNEIKRVGSLDDISPGERIYGVRYLGDLGYVVTFKQIDPLHVIDFSDPARPRQLGELKIPGYSAYLHPVGEGRLLGVGRDADTQGRPLGVSLSLFDVSDSANPTRLDAERLDDTYTQVEYDHHAFTWWEPKRLAVIPVELEAFESSPEGRPTSATSFAYGFRVTDDSITRIGRLTHHEHAKEYTGQITRSLVIDGTLYTLSLGGIAASDLDSFAERGWVALS